MFPAAAIAAVIALPAPVAGQTTTRDEVTFSRDIAPILQRSCQKCHRPDALAPMSLLSYDEVRPWARAIKNRTGLRDKPGVMPPWFIEKDIGIQSFKDDPSLSDNEIRLIAKWVDSGAPEGNPADLPPPVEFLGANEWEIGAPDLVVSSPTVEVPGESPDWWGAIGDAPTGLNEDRYVAALEYKEITESREGPRRNTVGGLFVVHHAVMSVVVPDAPADDGAPRLGGWPVHEVGRNADFFNAEAGRAVAGRHDAEVRQRPPACERRPHPRPPRHRLQVPSPGLRADAEDAEHGVRQRRRHGHRADGSRSDDGGVLHAAGPREDQHLRAAYARARRQDVPGRHRGHHRPDAQLRGVRPQLGARVHLRG